MSEDLRTIQLYLDGRFREFLIPTSLDEKFFGGDFFEADNLGNLWSEGVWVGIEKQR